MWVYIKIVLSCTLAGLVLATVFITPGGAPAGALKGLLVGLLIAWGEWRSGRTVEIVSYVKH